MKILIISPYFPHPRVQHGGGILIYSFLEQISKRHSVTLVSFVDEFESRGIDDVKKLPIELHVIQRRKGKQRTFAATVILILRRVIRLIQSIFLWRPYYVEKYTDRSMAHLIRSLTTGTSFDIVQIEYTQMAFYLKYVLSGKTILREHEVTFRPAYRRFRKESNPFLKPIRFIEFCQWAKFEMRFVKYFDHALTVTTQDSRLLHRFSGIDCITYFPPGIDIPPEASAERSPHSILFIGSFSHRPNVDAALRLIEKVFPITKRFCLDASLDIVGADVPREIVAAAAKKTGITIVGYVDDVLPYLQSRSVFAAPIRFGGGIKMKILHAMASGIPVVTTGIGAEGIVGADHTNICLADTDESIAEKICYLFNHKEEALKIGKNGSELMRKNYGWDSLISLYEETCNSILSVQ